MERELLISFFTGLFIIFVQSLREVNKDSNSMGAYYVPQVRNNKFYTILKFNFTWLSTNNLKINQSSILVAMNLQKGTDAKIYLFNNISLKLRENIKFNYIGHLKLQELRNTTTTISWALEIKEKKTRIIIVSQNRLEYRTGSIRHVLFCVIMRSHGKFFVLLEKIVT